MTRKRKRIWAFGLAVALGATGLCNYGLPVDKAVIADESATVEQDKIVFAQGEGIIDADGNAVDFSAGSWTFTGRGVNEQNQPYDVAEKFKPAIVDDATEGKYLTAASGADTTNVIRLIRGVQEGDQSGLESGTSYYDYRSGAAFLTDPIRLGTDARFNVTYTFSMPEAVVNYTQAGGEDYAREVGGDGIGFVMTTTKTDAVEAGSGIGYQNIKDSLTIEADSFFNGAYCYFKGNNAYDLTNWDFDNQLFFRQSGNDGGTNDFSANPYESGYISNYKNPAHEERFDHFAITQNGNVKDHNNIYYINKLDPTATEGNLYSNLTGTIQRYTNGSYAPYNTNGNKSPATPSKDRTCTTRFADKGVDDRLFTVWMDYDGKDLKVYYANGSLSKAKKPDTPIMTETLSLAHFEDKDIYVGFTSAVGTSKANHTIHSLKVTIPEKVTAQASYLLKYWLKNPATGEYELQEKDTSKTYTDNVGTKATAMDVDANYASKYDSKGYQLSQTKEQETAVELKEANTTYEMNVYYDPQEAYYKLNYYVKNDKGEYELKESTEVATDVVGSTHTITDVDPNYGTKYPNYSVNKEKNEDYEVTLTEAGKTYEMNVYYDPQTALPGVKLNYYKLNPTTGKYEYIESTEPVKAKVGDTTTVKDLDANYETKYSKDGYVYNSNKKETYTVDITENDKIYEVNAYYDPALTQYKTEYYLEQPDGSFLRQDADTLVTIDVYAGSSAEAAIRTYPGYTHTTVAESKEQDTVAADGSTVLKVYYKLEPVVTPVPTPVVTPEPTPVVTPEPTPVVTPEPTPVVTPEPTPVVTPEPTPVVTPEPTPVVTPEPTPVVTPEPTVKPTKAPTEKPKVTKEPEVTLDNDQPSDHTTAAPDSGDYTDWKLPLFTMIISGILSVFMLMGIRKKED